MATPFLTDSPGFRKRRSFVRALRIFGVSPRRQRPERAQCSINSHLRERSRLANFQISRPHSPRSDQLAAATVPPRGAMISTSGTRTSSPAPTTAEQIAAIDAEYERLQSEGPDFTGYHTGSEFREPPAHSITREDRIKILVQFDGIRAGLYKHCRSERGQAVSYNYRQVLGVLLSFAVKRGRVFPSLDTIARMAMVSKSHRAPRYRMVEPLRLPRQAPTHRADKRTTRSARAPDEQRLRALLPERSRRFGRQRLQDFP